MFRLCGFVRGFGGSQRIPDLLMKEYTLNFKRILEFIEGMFLS